MRVFVTGATGFVGSAVVRELLGAGHSVAGLARSDASAAALKAAGAEVVPCGLEDFDILARAAAGADGVIHAGFIHDFANFAASCVVDRKVIETLGTALAGSGKPFINTSGLAGLSAGRPATEDDMPDLAKATSPRAPSEAATLAFADKGVRAMLMRLAPSVHDAGDHGFVPQLIAIAREKGVAAYIGEGRNRWTGVHRPDAARLYRLALEKGTAGARYHAADEEGVATREIAEVIGKRLNLPVVSKTPEEAPSHFGWMAYFFSLDMPASSAKTRAALGWQPTGPRLLADLDTPHYFAG